MIIVTGAAGFIGKHLTRYLLMHTGDVIVGVDNLRRGDWNGLTPNERLVTITGDIRDSERLDRLFTDVRLVFHLAGQAQVMDSVWDQDYTFSSNVAGTYNVLRASQRAGVGHVVFTSSREVYGEPSRVPVPEESPLIAKNPYGASKIASEAYCRLFDSENGMRVSVARLTNVYGPGDQGRVIPAFIKQALQGLPLVLYGGQQVIDFVPVRVVVEALWRLALEPFSAPINVGSGIGVTLQDVAARIIQKAGSDSEIEIAPARPEEVVRFVADVSRMRGSLQVEVPEDPLVDLPARVAVEEAEVVRPISIGFQAR